MFKELVMKRSRKKPNPWGFLLCSPWGPCVLLLGMEVAKTSGCWTCPGKFTAQEGRTQHRVASGEDRGGVSALGEGLGQRRPILWVEDLSLTWVAHCRNPLSDKEMYEQRDKP